MTIGAVIFDVGGVLLLPNGQLVADALRQEAGVPLDAQRCSRAWAQAVAELDQASLAPERQAVGSAHLERWLAAAGVPPQLLARAAPPVSRLLAAPVELWSWLVQGARACLVALQARGLRLACVSNGEGTVAQELARNGLAGFFEIVVDSGLLAMEKPDPGIFRLATDALALPPSACLYVGDTVAVDMLGALGAGLAACHLDTLGLYRDRPRAFRRVRALAEIPGLVASAAGYGSE